MTVALVTGSGGLIGSETVRHLAALGFSLVGIDNDMRRQFFGDEASTRWNLEELHREVPGYRHHEVDIRERAAVEAVFARYGRAIGAVVHTAAQPSHDWAASDPHTDFSINAVGTLNLLECARQHCPQAAFVFTSTNKVYGDAPNEIPLRELPTRWEVAADGPYAGGIGEDMRIDASKHSLFGVSKAAADLMVQEYGRYFGMNTVCFRGGCLTGPRHAGTKLHGFLAYLMKCATTRTPYTVYGYQGKQVRDNIHAQDLVLAFSAYIAKPRPAAVYNIGGGTRSNCSMLEAIAMCEEITGRQMAWTYAEANRIGDHIWYVSDLARFRRDYPHWDITRTVPDILREMHDANQERWLRV
jgi:CDP-paratose 2-epimerase